MAHIVSGDTNLEIDRIMKRIELAVTTAVFLFCSANPCRANIELDFSPVIGAAVSFDAHGDIGFTPAPTSSQFSITSAGPENGDTGYVTSPAGGFAITGIQTIPGGTQAATVSGAGTLTIVDNLGNLFTATLTMLNVKTIGNGLHGNVNVNGGIDLTGIAYHGTQTDLVALRNIGSATYSMNWTFPSSAEENLTYLVANADSTTSWTGEITAVPEQSTSLVAAFLGLLLASSAIWNFRKSQLA
jgi:hypothetical protein